jgi:hypothetical protein
MRCDVADLAIGAVSLTMFGHPVRQTWMGYRRHRQLFGPPRRCTGKGDIEGGRPVNGQQTGWRPPRRFSVVVQRLARSPLPWAWAIHEDGATDPCHRSSRFYPSAEEAWAVGSAMLTRMTARIHRAGTEAERTDTLASGPVQG